ncbi:MAG: glycerol-3-phosphate 1-O-acyltransferase PlsY [Candidatus Omnitrophica bacterium]|nr:glycerol-3-phosphate 1-O-acyltransferase PlsY [Candidatus Omnitrophota bacterium]
MAINQILVFILAAYFIGSIPFGFLTGKLVKGIDIRESGSRNIGATNVFRVVGKPWGISVFILDALKGYFAVHLVTILGEPAGFSLIKLFLGIAVILGHTFPVWLRFRGGKGVATSLGVFMALALKPTLITFGVWIAVFIISHIISISSLVAALVFPIVLCLTDRHIENFAWLFGTSLLLAGFIFYTHRANITRLIKGEEKRLF